MTGNDWLWAHAMRRWLAKMEAEGPEPAPTAEVKQLVRQRHAERCADFAERIERRKGAAER